MQFLEFKIRKIIPQEIFCLIILLMLIIIGFLFSIKICNSLIKKVNKAEKPININLSIDYDWMIIPYCLMKCASIIPESHIIFMPSITNLKINIFTMIK